MMSGIIGEKNERPLRVFFWAGGAITVESEIEFWDTFPSEKTELYINFSHVHLVFPFLRFFLLIPLNPIISMAPGFSNYYY